VSKLPHTASEIAMFLKLHIETVSPLIALSGNVLTRLLTQSRSATIRPLSPTLSGTGEDGLCHS